MNHSSLQDLIEAALKASCAAYAPYSTFEVGAALRAEDGAVFTGCNVENASFGLTVCAERIAVFNAVSAGNTRFSALAVVCSAARGAYPCGACLQVLSEFCTPQFPIAIASRSDPAHPVTVTLGDLLPHGFRLDP